MSNLAVVYEDTAVSEMPLRFFVYLCMTKSNLYILDFEIDKLTDSILNRISGDSFRTEISLATKTDLRDITKSNGWLFDWKYEFDQPDREVYKLTIINNLEIVQGLISLTVKPNHGLHVFIGERAIQHRKK